MLGALIGAHQLCLRLVIAAVGLVLDSLTNCTNSSRSGVSEVAFNPFDAFYPVLNSFEKKRFNSWLCNTKESQLRLISSK